MKLIKSSVINITPNRFFEEDILKHIELCGRTCYKSEDKITDTSAEKFVNMLKKNKHRSVLEHGTVYLWTKETSYNFMGVWRSDLFDRYDKNPYSVAYMDGPEVYITTNYRVIIENGWESDLDFIDDEFGMFHIQRYTFSITCSRAIANEIVRHRAMSFSQESTRYVSYSSKKSLKEFNCDSESDICKAYLQGFSMKNIADSSSFTEWGIRKILLKNNIELRGLNNKGNRIEDYFSIIDTPEKAYLLGIIQTDGNIRTNTHKSTLIITQHKDYAWYINYMLQLFSEYVSQTNDRNCKQMQIGSKQIVSDLINLGIVPNKTKLQTDDNIKTLWDSIPEEFKGDFIRGCIDGDGHVTYFTQEKGINESCNIGLCSVKEILIDLIIEYIKNNFGYLCGKSKEGNVYKLCITSPSKAKLIGTSLYKNFKYPFGHPKKSSAWLSRLDLTPTVAEFKDDKFLCIEPSNFNSYSHITKFEYIKALLSSEDAYINLRLMGWKPEEARGVLPLDLKTDLIVTGTVDQWKEFFELRCAKSAHPDVQVIANKIKKYIYEPY